MKAGTSRQSSNNVCPTLWTAKLTSVLALKWQRKIPSESFVEVEHDTFFASNGNSEKIQCPDVTRMYSIAH